MNNAEWVGYLASLLMLASFCMRDMTALRVMAIGANLAFIGYGVLAHLGPVLMLHALLLPLNIVRLVQMGSAQGGSAGVASAGHRHLEGAPGPGCAQPAPGGGLSRPAEPVPLQRPPRSRRD